MQAPSRAKNAALVVGVSIITFGAVGHSAAPASTASTLVNAAPVALDRALDVVEGVPISVVLPAFDPDDDPLEFTIQTTNSGFSALNEATGEFSYTWLPGQTTTVEFSVSDGQLASALATVTIRVRPSGTPVLPMAIVGRPINPRIALVDQATNTVIREIETTFGTGGGNFVAPTRPASIESRTRFLPWRSTY